MTRADSSMLLGRSRDTTTVGAAASLFDSIDHRPRVPVRLVAWGVTDADVEHAIDRAEVGPGRYAWEFVETERLGDLPCPLAPDDPRALAQEAGYHWAYVAYRAEPVDG